MQAEHLPAHVAIIMDGNGRWAKARGLPRSMGHRQGAQTVRTLARYANELGLGYLTLYAFSTENWTRPADEVAGIMALLREYLTEVQRYEKENIRTLIIGDRSRLDADICRQIDRLEAASAQKTGLTLIIALNYGGRDEIVHAARALARRAAAGELAPECIDEAAFASCLYTAGIPDPDLIIRPSGEQRLSNFLLWQAAYAEFIYMDVLWPDFSPRDLDSALASYAKRSRRFGGLQKEESL